MQPAPSLDEARPIGSQKTSAAVATSRLVPSISFADGIQLKEYASNDDAVGPRTVRASSFHLGMRSNDSDSDSDCVRDVHGMAFLRSSDQSSKCTSDSDLEDQPRPVTRGLLLEREQTKSSSHSHSPRSRSKSPSLLELSKRPSRTDVLHADLERVIYQKANPRRHTLEPLDNVTLYIDDGTAEPAANVDNEGRITAYNPLPPVSPSSQRKGALGHVQFNRRHSLTVNSLFPREDSDDSVLVQPTDPFARPVLAPIGSTKAITDDCNIPPSGHQAMTNARAPVALHVLRSRSRNDINSTSPLRKLESADALDLHSIAPSSITTKISPPTSSTLLAPLPKLRESNGLTTTTMDLVMLTKSADNDL